MHIILHLMHFLYESAVIGIVYIMRSIMSNNKISTCRIVYYIIMDVITIEYFLYPRFRYIYIRPVYILSLKHRSNIIIISIYIGIYRYNGCSYSRNLLKFKYPIFQHITTDHFTYKYYVYVRIQK